MASKRRFPAIISVEQGRVVVNAAWVAACAPNAFVIEADLKAKYAVVAALSGNSVMLDINEDTKNVDHQITEPTVVTLRMRRGWTLHAEIGRYTLYIFGYRRNRQGPMIWPPK